MSSELEAIVSFYIGLSSLFSLNSLLTALRVLAEDWKEFGGEVLWVLLFMLLMSFLAGVLWPAFVLEKIDEFWE